MLGIEGLAVAAALTVASVWPVGYVQFAPGSARATEPLIRVEGAETYPSDGEVLFTTVHVDGISSRLSALNAIGGWYDDDTTVISRSLVLGDDTAEENREQNQLLMAESKDVASAVALSYLGYDVPVTGTGATIVEVEPGKPADGLLVPGDTITAIGGEPVSFSDDLAARIRAHPPGDTVTLTVEGADGATRAVDATLAARDDAPESGLLGVRSQTRDLDYTLPFDIIIDSGRVGGPSAGLAFTLALLDYLTPGELTGGDVVAVTGTMSSDGTVGPVGGVEQKMAAARRAGAAVFLVPPQEYEQASAVAERIGLRVEQVATLDDALTVLASLGGNALALPRTAGQGA